VTPVRATRPSAHFAWQEFGSPDGYGVPPGSKLAVRRLCAEVLEPMRRKFGVCTVHSGFRTLAHNREVGGAPRSHHLYGHWPSSPAADVSFRTGTPQLWAAAAARLGVGGIGLYPGHVHLDQRPGQVRW
jgi:zinc D-Ala-D-Ala carboxypeptidase